METSRLYDVTAAAQVIRSGGLVAFPTETVFGLGADATNSPAVEKIFAAKGRPSDNPLIVHLSRLDQWPLAARVLSDSAAKFCRVFAPGPLTVVLPKNERICGAVTANRDTVGIRIPSNDVAHQLLEAAAVPIAAPSANMSGRPSCTRWQSVLEDLDGRIDAVLCHNPSTVGLESTVVDCCREPPMVLRTGAISLQELRDIVPGTEQLEASAAIGPEADSSFLSPGIRHPHYRPRATVALFVSDLTELDLDTESAGSLSCCGISIPQIPRGCTHSRIFSSVSDYAMHFYEFLREADRRGATLIACQLAPLEGIGIALRDRQLRAAGQIGG